MEILIGRPGEKQSRFRNPCNDNRASCAIICYVDEWITGALSPTKSDHDRGGLENARRVALVSDGNARWAAQRGLSIDEGHRAAADNLIARIVDAIELGIEELTVYAFSTENWSRPDEEVSALIAMLTERIERDTPTLDAHGVRVGFIGRRDRCGTRLAATMRRAEQHTRDNERIRVFVAFDYGGRDEIVRAAERYRGGGEAAFAQLLGTAHMHDPDLVIRTSGEQRLSNFLLWQSAYAELVFRRELWPDFGRSAFEQSLAEFARRQRRFGTRALAMGSSSLAQLPSRTEPTLQDPTIGGASSRLVGGPVADGALPSASSSEARQA